jgi:hypothetical protein
MARSLENMLKSERRFAKREALEWNPLDDISKNFFFLTGW